MAYALNSEYNLNGAKFISDFTVFDTRFSQISAQFRKVPRYFDSWISKLLTKNLDGDLQTKLGGDCLTGRAAYRVSVG